MHFALAALLQKDGAVAFERHEPGDRPARGADGEPLQIFADLIQKHDDGALHVLPDGKRADGGNEHQKIFIEKDPRMKSALKGARHVSDDGGDDRPARGGEGGEIQPERDPPAPDRGEIEHERRDKEDERNGNGNEFLEMALLFLRRGAVHDLHFFEMRNGIERLFERGVPLVAERNALRDKIDGDFGETFDRLQLLLQLRRAGGAVEIADAYGTLHGILLRIYS